MDPLTKSYPMLTPYQFASNRPIDGIDLDGLEWMRSTNNESGKTEIQVNTTLDVYEGMTSATQAEILKETNLLFNTMVDKASGGNASILVSFNNKKKDNQNYVPLVTIVGNLQEGNAVSVGGLTIGGDGAIVSGYNIKGEPNSSSNIANSIVHELLHSIRIETSESQTKDSELIKRWENGDRRFYTTENTHSSIYKNILMYVFRNIDGMSATQRFGQGTEMNEITPGQLNLMYQEIDLQMKGYGVHPYDSSKTPNENNEEYDRRVFNYWLNLPKLKED